MAKSRIIAQKKDKYQADNGDRYMDKRTVVRRARAAGKVAASNAMKTMGYVVVARNGWVIRIFADGREEKIAPVEK